MASVCVIQTGKKRNITDIFNFAVNTCGIFFFNFRKTEKNLLVKMVVFQG